METQLICSECGTGNYALQSMVSANVGVCTDCGHEVNVIADVWPNLESGEVTVWSSNDDQTALVLTVVS